MWLHNYSVSVLCVTTGNIFVCVILIQVNGVVVFCVTGLQVNSVVVFCVTVLQVKPCCGIVCVSLCSR